MTPTKKTRESNTPRKQQRAAERQQWWEGWRVFNEAEVSAEDVDRLAETVEDWLECNQLIVLAVISPKKSAYTISSLQASCPAPKTPKLELQPIYNQDQEQKRQKRPLAKVQCVIVMTSVK